MPPNDRTGDSDDPRLSEWAGQSRVGYKDGQIELALFLSEPDAPEIAAVRRGPAEFGLFNEDGLCVLCYQFAPSIPQAYVIYHYGEVPPGVRIPLLDPKQLPSEFRAGLRVLLVDAERNFHRGDTANCPEC